MANNKTLKGLFIKKMLDKLENKELNEEDKQIIEKAIEVGLEALE